MSSLGHVPAPGDELDIGPIRLMVEHMDGARLLTVVAQTRAHDAEAPQVSGGAS